MYVYTMNYILVYGNQRNETRSEKNCEPSRAAKNGERTTSYSKNRVECSRECGNHTPLEIQ